MLNFQSYIQKLYDADWIIPHKYVKDYEEKLHIKLKKEGEIYRLEKILYSPLDTLIMFESVDFALVKVNDKLTIKMYKI